MIALTLLQLLAEASRVVDIRVRMMAAGKASSDEMFLMVTEKMEAMEHAGRVLMGGGSPELVVANYRKIVAANVVRLSA